MLTQPSMTESLAYLRQVPHVNRLIFEVCAGTLISVLCNARSHSLGLSVV